MQRTIYVKYTSSYEDKGWGKKNKNNGINSFAKRPWWHPCHHMWIRSLSCLRHVWIRFCSFYCDATQWRCLSYLPLMRDLNMMKKYESFNSQTIEKYWQCKQIKNIISIHTLRLFYPCLKNNIFMFSHKIYFIFI